MTNLEIARLDAGLSQEELARKLGVTRQYISDCERGVRKFGVRTLIKCADVLGVSPDTLLRSDTLTISKKKALPAELIIDIMSASEENIQAVWKYLRYLRSKKN